MQKIIRDTAANKKVSKFILQSLIDSKKPPSYPGEG
jgi:hypothetical protein